MNNNFKIKIKPAYVVNYYVYLGINEFTQYKPKQNVKIIDEDGIQYLKKTHSREPRVDGLVDWYKKYNIKVGEFITVSISEVNKEILIYLCRPEATNISKEINDIVEIFPDEIEEIESKALVEGSNRVILVNRFERNKEARKKCIEFYGFSCSVCNFNFSEKYGKLGNGFIHVHHLKPISEIKSEYEIDPINDLRPVCPNCHAMLHKYNPPLSIEELKELISLN